MSARRSRLGAVFGEDLNVVARFVDIWRHPRSITGVFKEGEPETPVSLNDIAWELGIGASKVAITMRYAERDGWVRRTSPRTEQAAWEPTEKALAQFPDGEPQVMPLGKDVSLGPGVRARSVSGDEARTWGEDDQWRRITPQKRRGGAVEPKEGFRGYLPPGDDAA